MNTNAVRRRVSGRSAIVNSGTKTRRDIFWHPDDQPPLAGSHPVSHLWDFPEPRGLCLARPYPARWRLDGIASQHKNDGMNSGGRWPGRATRAMTTFIGIRDAMPLIRSPGRRTSDSGFHVDRPWDATLQCPRAKLTRRRSSQPTELVVEPPKDPAFARCPAIGAEKWRPLTCTTANSTT